MEPDGINRSAQEVCDIVFVNSGITCGDVAKAQGHWASYTDPELTARGQDIAKELGSYLQTEISNKLKGSRGKGNDYFLTGTSPFLQAQQTAELMLDPAELYTIPYIGSNKDSPFSLMKQNRILDTDACMRSLVPKRRFVYYKNESDASVSKFMRWFYANYESLVFKERIHRIHSHVFTQLIELRDILASLSTIEPPATRLLLQAHFLESCIRIIRNAIVQAPRSTLPFSYFRANYLHILAFELYIAFHGFLRKIAGDKSSWNIVINEFRRAPYVDNVEDLLAIHSSDPANAPVTVTKVLQNMQEVLEIAIERSVDQDAYDQYTQIVAPSAARAEGRDSSRHVERNRSFPDVTYNPAGTAPVFVFFTQNEFITSMMKRFSRYPTVPKVLPYSAHHFSLFMTQPHTSSNAAAYHPGFNYIKELEKRGGSLTQLIGTPTLDVNKQVECGMEDICRKPICGRRTTRRTCAERGQNRNQTRARPPPRLPPRLPANRPGAGAGPVLSNAPVPQTSRPAGAGAGIGVSLPYGSNTRQAPPPSRSIQAAPPPAPPSAPPSAPAPTSLPVNTFRMFLVRHGVSCANLKKAKGQWFTTYTDPELTRAGKDKAVHRGGLFRAYLNQQGIEEPIVGASVLMRAQQTAFLMMGADQIYVVPYISEKGPAWFGETEDNKPVRPNDRRLMAEKERIMRSIGVTDLAQALVPAPSPLPADANKPSIPKFKAWLKNTYPSLTESAPRPLVLFTHGNYIAQFIKDITRGATQIDREDRPNYSVFEFEVTLRPNADPLIRYVGGRAPIAYDDGANADPSSPYEFTSKIDGDKECEFEGDQCRKPVCPPATRRQVVPERNEEGTLILDTTVSGKKGISTPKAPIQPGEGAHGDENYYGGGGRKHKRTRKHRNQKRRARKTRRVFNK
jgi:broad specificity phosphatase PhoE